MEITVLKKMQHEEISMISSKVKINVLKKNSNKAARMTLRSEKCRNHYNFIQIQLDYLIARPLIHRYFVALFFRMLVHFVQYVLYEIFIINRIYFLFCVCVSKSFAHPISQRRVWGATARKQSATLAKRLMRLPRKQKVVSSNLTGGSFFFSCFKNSNGF